MSPIVATKEEIQKVEMQPTTCRVFSMSLQLPQVFGSLEKDLFRKQDGGLLQGKKKTQS
jgi:hypothetical protein